MSNLGECRYCGQPIGTAQLKRIEEAEQEQASQLKRSLQAELQNATADLQEHVNEATRQKDDAEQRLEDLETALPARIGEEVATATEQLAAELQTTKQKAADFEQHLQESVEAAEKKVRQEAETGFYKDLHEKDKKLQAALTTIEGLQKKLESKPAHELGSFQEDDLVRVLQVEFPRDKIGRNPKSSGADVMHEVFQDGENCGLIVYESKNAANWSSGWVPKLKADALIHNATARILVSTSFPAKSEDFTFVDGVPVLHPRFVVDFVKVIRNSLVEIKQQALRRGARDKGDYAGPLKC